MDLYRQQLVADAQRRQNQENAARMGAAFGSMTSSGQGSIEWGDKIDFGMTFVQLPWVQCGHTFNADEYREDLGLGDAADVPLPIISNYVTEWDRDANGFYVGAWVAARVHVPWKFDDDMQTLVPSVDPTLKIDVVHFFKFEAIGMKAVPVDEAGVS